MRAAPLLLGVLVVLLLGGTGVIASDSVRIEPAQSSSIQEVNYSDALPITDEILYRDNGGTDYENVGAKVVFRNDLDRRISYAEVLIRYYAENESLLDIERANTVNVYPEEQWYVHSWVDYPIAPQVAFIDIEIIELNTDSAPSQVDSYQSIVEQRLNVTEELPYQENAGTDYENVGVKAVLTNEFSENLSYAEVLIRYYDSNGTVVDIDRTNTLDLRSGEQWYIHSWVDYPLSTRVSNISIEVIDAIRE